MIFTVRFASILLSLVTAICALPVSEQEDNSTQIVHFTQTQLSTGEPKKFSRRIGECTNVYDENVPTRIQTLGQTKPLKLVTYSAQSCPDDHHVRDLPVSQAGIVVNDRHPINSFRLVQQTGPGQHATLRFSDPYFNVTLNNVNCNNGTGRNWPQFAKSLEIRMNRQRTNIGIHIFTNGGCDEPFLGNGKGEDVRSGTNLVGLTRKDGVIIKSFVFNDD